MFKLDNALLEELGLASLSPQDKNRMLQHIYEKLEMNVGVRLAQGMSDQQLNEFEQLMPAEQDTPEVRKQKEQAALTWLETNFPNYKQVVAEELDKLKAEIKSQASQIIAATQQQSTQEYQQPPAAPQY
jgi:hypothetical protein